MNLYTPDIPIKAGDLWRRLYTDRPHQEVRILEVGATYVMVQFAIRMRVLRRRMKLPDWEPVPESA